MLPMTVARCMKKDFRVLEDDDAIEGILAKAGWVAPPKKYFLVRDALGSAAEATTLTSHNMSRSRIMVRG